VGIADADMFMSSFVFMTHAATDDLLRSPGTTSFVLVNTDEPDAVRARIERSGLAVLTRDQLKANDLAVMSRPFAVPMRVMLAVAFAVGSLVIALTTYSAIVEHRRDYGIIKALGATRHDLYRVALTQSLIVAAVGLVAGGIFFVVGRQLIMAVRPQFAIVLTSTAIARVAAVALVMGLVAAVLPASRLVRLDPSTAYRGG
jgi:putative ABC transport system permease protein